MKQSLVLFAIFLFTCFISGILSSSAMGPEGEVRRPTRPEKVLAMQLSTGKLLQRAVQDENSGRLSQAIRKYRQLTRRSVSLKREEVPKIYFRLAKLLQRAKRLQQAFNVYQTLIKRYPAAKYFNASIAEQTRIANFYLEKPDGILTGSLNSNAEIAQRMYERILISAPFCDYAPLVQFNLCLAHERQGHVRDALRSYQTLFEKYPDSKLAIHAQYQVACIHMHVGLSKSSQDFSALSKAKDAFQDYLSKYPKTRYQAEILKNIEKINAKASSKIYRIAKYYDHRQDYQSACIYYNEVLRYRPPISMEAVLAKRRIEVIRSR